MENKERADTENISVEGVPHDKKKEGEGDFLDGKCQCTDENEACESCQ